MTTSPPSYAWSRRHRLLVLSGEAGPEILLSTHSSPAALCWLLLQFPGSQLRAVSDEELQHLLDRTHADQAGTELAITEATEASEDLERLMESAPDLPDDLLAVEDDAPVIRMLNALFAQAIRRRASDVHLEVFEQRCVVRVRIDGQLQDLAHPHRRLHAALISRIKIMASLDIAEKRLPQDGRIALRLGGRGIDVRVSVLPTAHGERAVLRILDKTGLALQPHALGMSAATQQTFDRLINVPHGIVLVTGPTGSGKTTTLYSALVRLAPNRRNILTVEDPVEYDLPGIAQTAVQPRIGLDFATTLRAMLRQDPDVIMVGEIRDAETARIAVQAALTGHLVLATLHTNDAASAVARLIDMGVEPFLLSSALTGIVAQRLLRRLCSHCKVLDADTGRWRAVGCGHCQGTGYRGRAGVFEMLEVSPEIRTLVHKAAPSEHLARLARAQGMMTLRDDAERWVLNGETTLDEVLLTIAETPTEDGHAALPV